MSQFLYFCLAFFFCFFVLVLGIDETAGVSDTGRGTRASDLVTSDTGCGMGLRDGGKSGAVSVALTGGDMPKHSNFYTDKSL